MNERLIEQAREEYRESRARIEGEISELRHEMRAEFSNMRSEISGMRTEILHMSAEMRRTTRWIIGVIFGAVASLSVLLPVVWQLAERWL
ncbi:MAG: hypothetical protein CMN77_05855 [Spirochaetaceae bacterium]|nr:hypothetical protein [Spirochaetaceae bacterium]|tara:strand:+ start:67743 stop:68012 length:270 start_codon:yes stop_codon:yes gene_type:complete